MPAPPTPAQASLPSPVQSQAWTGQLGQQLVQFARQGGEQQIEMRLNPAELGPLSVTLKMTEQGAQAQFLSAHAQVRQVLEQAIPQLREALAEQGISLGETSVGEQRHQEARPLPTRRIHGATEPVRPKHLAFRRRYRHGREWDRRQPGWSGQSLRLRQIAKIGPFARSVPFIMTRAISAYCPFPAGQTLHDRQGNGEIDGWLIQAPVADDTAGTDVHGGSRGSDLPGHERP
ncbi:flagellar hook-length control protein FliK [Halomonas sp. BC04]|uniref:flagellar hook-length control protein FliK n=1 Tax=Halomonas sp. BC04 TaxID=1403540 RepID=UPI0004B16818